MENLLVKLSNLSASEWTFPEKTTERNIQFSVGKHFFMEQPLHLNSQT